MPINVEFHAGSLTLFVEKLNASSDVQFAINLTRSEYLVLRELVVHIGQHLSKEHLIFIGWPCSYVGPNSLNMTIMYLRKKLCVIGGFWEISTIQRHGYSLNLSIEHRNETVSTVGV